MFSNFNKAFKQNSLKSSIPREILETLSRNAPDGTSYIPTDKNVCILKFDKVDNHISIPKISFQEIKKQIDNNNIKTPDELFSYLYNSQKSLTFNIDSDDDIKINGKVIKFSDFIINPFKNRVSKGSGTVTVEPEKLPKPFTVTLKFGKSARIFTIQRKPNDSIAVAKFESISKGCFHFEYYVDLQNDSVKFKIKYDRENATDIQDVIDAFELYNAFCEGKVLWGDSKIGNAIETIDEKIAESYITYWRKLNALQALLKTNFDYKQELTASDQLNILRLYRSLILKKPYKEYVNFDQIEVTDTSCLSSIKQNQNLAMGFIEHDHLNLLGCNLELFSIVIVYNILVSSYEKKENNKYVIHFKPVKNKKTCRSIQCFTSEDEAKDKHNEEGIIEAFHNAKVITLNED